MLSYTGKIITFFETLGNVWKCQVFCYVSGVILARYAEYFNSVISYNISCTFRQHEPMFSAFDEMAQNIH